MFYLDHFFNAVHLPLIYTDALSGNSTHDQMFQIPHI